MTRVTGLVKDITHSYSSSVVFKANYKNGRLHGLKQTWFWDGVLRSEGFYVNGKKEGVHRVWFSNGQLKERLEYHNDGLQGVQKSWYENGQISLEISYKDGFKHGISRSWDENGQLISEKNYGISQPVVRPFSSKNPISKDTVIYPDQKSNIALDKEGNLYVNQQLFSGLYMQRFDDSGNIEMQVQYVKGLRHGNEIDWYENGTIYGQGDWTHGQKHNEWKSYYQNGQLFIQNYYVNGVLRGLCKSWHKSGVLKKEQYYVNGKTNWIKRYFESGNIQLECWNTNNKHLRKIFFESGEVEFLFENCQKIRLDKKGEIKDIQDWDCDFNCSEDELIDSVRRMFDDAY